VSDRFVLFLLLRRGTVSLQKFLQSRSSLLLSTSLLLPLWLLLLLLWLWLSPEVRLIFRWFVHVSATALRSFALLLQHSVDQ